MPGSRRRRATTSSRATAWPAVIDGDRRQTAEDEGNHRVVWGALRPGPVCYCASLNTGDAIHSLPLQYVPLVAHRQPIYSSAIELPTVLRLAAVTTPFPWPLHRPIVHPARLPVSPSTPTPMLCILLRRQMILPHVSLIVANWTLPPQ